MANDLPFKSCLYTVNHTILFAAWKNEVIQIMNLWLASFLGICLHTFQQQKLAS